MDALFWHRLQFGFTVTFHYLFAQLTMGIALLLVIFEGLGLKSGSPVWRGAARFWGRLFGLTFAAGVVTGIPLEFQFGTNWASFSNAAGGVIGQTLAMEGVFAFFLESTFLGLFLFGEKRLSPRAHFLTALAVFAGSWISGYFIVVTNAFMQHPRGHAMGTDGRLVLADLWEFLLNPWALWQYAHTMCSATASGAFAVCAVAASWALLGRHPESSRAMLKGGVAAGLASSLLLLFPTGDQHGKLVADHQPPALAAMEGVFESGPYKEIALIGQPDVARRRLENPVVVPGVLSYLAYGSFGSRVVGLNQIPQDQWPDNIELLYYAYHIMVGLGTLHILVMLGAALQLLRGRLTSSRKALWALIIAFPFPIIATTAGWFTAELGRQPWIIWGLMRTAKGPSPTVSAGNTIFTYLGFSGLYLGIGILYLWLVGREIARGPAPVPESSAGAAAAPPA